ncbi:hypothetical protein QFI66_000905 [Raoultella sp. BAC10a-01-01]|uniref:Uncharacterized protein n=1 Tax=Raoultella scottii TaxID=3040937 RepID=A0ABU8YZY8_9ENTR
MTLNKNSSLKFNALLLEKIPEVLGKSPDQFLTDELHTNEDGTQETRKVYEFPARETFLVAMSMSYELQAATYDYMRELDRQQGGFLRYSIEDLNNLVSETRQNPDKHLTNTSDGLKNYQDTLALLERAEYMVGMLTRLWLGWLKDEAKANSPSI